MAITINIYYSGKNGNAVKFAKEMISSGIVQAIRNETGNLRYDYFLPIDESETVLLIDSWKDQNALDIHHSLPLMGQIAALREKYDLHMKVERYVLDEAESEHDDAFIRK
ncbi:MAG: antibiotic biosynthesis monooxygenase [Clostridia bacterium]|nr:antibiotic biosynthesis monooxygenase [Clostridia bacterium]